jgi:hypothetical protein
MTEASTVPASAIASIGQMGPQAQQTAINAFKDAGYNVTDLAGALPATVPGALSEVPAPIAPKAVPEIERQYRAIAAVWRGDPKQLADAATAAGVDLATPPLDPAAAALAEHTAAVQAAIAAPANASEYGNLQYSNANDISADDLAKQASAVTSTFAKVGVPVAQAQPLLDAILHASTQYPPLDETASPEDTERRQVADEIRRREEGYRISVMQDKEVLKYGEIALAALKAANPTWHHAMYAKGSFFTAEVFAQLASVGRAISARKGEP